MYASFLVLISLFILGGLLMCFVHPLICLIECLASSRLSPSGKAAWTLAMLVLSPVASTLYGFAGTQSGGLRRLTSAAFGVLTLVLLSGFAIGVSEPSVVDRFTAEVLAQMTFESDDDDFDWNVTAGLTPSTDGDDFGVAPDPTFCESVESPTSDPLFGQSDPLFGKRDPLFGQAGVPGKSTSDPNPQRQRIVPESRPPASPASVLPGDAPSIQDVFFEPDAPVTTHPSGGKAEIPVDGPPAIRTNPFFE